MPTSAAPQYTVADIIRAGTDLMMKIPARQQDLTALLQNFQLRSVSDLRPEQIAPFAQALRGLGAEL